MITLNPKTLGNEELNEKFEYDEIDDAGRRVIKQGEMTYLIRCNHRSGLWDIYTDRGGTTPLELQGLYTTINAAEQALASYHSRKSNEGIIARRHKEKLGPNFDNRADNYPSPTAVNDTKKKEKKEV